MMLFQLQMLYSEEGDRKMIMNSM